MDALVASASHGEFLAATNAMNARLAALDLDAMDIEELEDPEPEKEPAKEQPVAEETKGE